MAASVSPIEQARVRALNYWHIDGLPTFLAGLALTFFAVAIALMDLLPRTMVTRLISFEFLAVFTALIVLQNRILERVKAWLTWPRSGYALAPPDLRVATPIQTLSIEDSADPTVAAGPSLRDWMLIGLVMLAPGLLEMLSGKSPEFAAATVVLAGAFFALTRSYGRSQALIAVAAAAAGTAIAFLPVPETFRAHLFLVCVGLTVVLKGAVDLVLYLLQNPRPRQ
jgi:hypothetical protein